MCGAKQKSRKMAENIKSSITTVVRVRPPLPAVETRSLDTCDGGISNILTTENNYRVSPVSDCVLGSGVTQDQVFHSIYKPQLDRFVRGKDVSFIVFGAAQSGKSYTMFGPGVNFNDSEVNYGLLPRAAAYIFAQFETSQFQCPDYSLTLSMLEIVDFTTIRDLVKIPNNTRFSPNTSDKGLFEIQGLTQERCKNARELMAFIRQAMNCRMTMKNNMFTLHSTSVYIRLELRQPDVHGRQAVSIALFVDMAPFTMYHPLYKDPTDQGMLVLGDLCILDTMAKTNGNTPEIPEVSEGFKMSVLFTLLKDSFNGVFETTVVCCISPCTVTAALSFQYMRVLADVTVYRKGLPPLECNTDHSNGSVQMNQSQASSLISQAELLLSRLSLSDSISNEDKEQLHRWLHMKKECEEDSQIGHSHCLLECIEEVTESEEELASSNEKMSELHLSMDNSPCESDQEEGDNKGCQITDDFYKNLDQMCDQFNTFVDTFVGSFKSKAAVSPAKELKRACSAARRGGMPCLPKMNAACSNDLMLQSDTDSSSSSFVSVDPSFYECRKQRSLEEKLQQSDDKEKREKERYTSNPEVVGGLQVEEDSAIEHIPISSDGKTTTDVQERCTWYEGKTPSYCESAISGWIASEIEEITKLGQKWSKWIQQVESVADATFIKQMHPIRVEKYRDLFRILEGLTMFRVVADEVMEDDITLDNSESVLYHHIRKFRYWREVFSLYKNKLDKKVKEKTSCPSELRDHLICEEMLDALDTNIEYVNNIMQGTLCSIPTLNDSDIARDVIKQIGELSPIEVRNLLLRMFVKVIDLREAGKSMEKTITELDQKIAADAQKILYLNAKLQQERTLSGSQLVVRYPQHSNERSALAIPEGTGATVRPAAIIPQHNLNKLHIKPAPPTKVTFKARKLIIEQDVNNTRRKKH